MFIAIDFDGTIADHQFPEVGDAVPGAFEWMIKFKKAGAILILWTLRSDGGKHEHALSNAVAFCEANGVKFDLVNENPQSWTTSPKPYAHVYIDDTAFGCPLIDNPREGGKALVDWEKIGPVVLEKLEEKKKVSARWKQSQGSWF